MNRTKIEWVRNPDGTPGFTFNPITGCMNHINGLCLGGGFPCYAYRLANGRLRTRYLANKCIIEYPPGKAGDAYADPFYPRFWEDRLLPSFSHDVISGREKGIFVCDMGELFGDWVPKEWQEKVFRVIELFPEHRFYLLTKQPQNLIQFSPFPDNCWVGVTATDLNMARTAIAHLSGIEAKVKYISFEPLLGRILDGADPIETASILKRSGINWVIIGAQTKPYKPPKIEWVEEIVTACDKAEVPVFIKDNLKFEWGISQSPCFKHLSNGVHKLRQELPR